MAGTKGRSGGLRTGAGRKPQTARVLNLRGGRDRAVARPAAVPSAPVAMPEALPPEVQAIWVELAPHAMAAATLTAGMVPSFVRLCRAVAKQARWEAQIARDGDTYLKVTIDGSGQEHFEVKAHPLISKAQGLESQIRAWMKDFAINPFGKPLAVAEPAADPFAEFA